MARPQVQVQGGPGARISSNLTDLKTGQPILHDLVNGQRQPIENVGENSPVVPAQLVNREQAQASATQQPVLPAKLDPNLRLKDLRNDKLNSQKVSMDEGLAFLVSAAPNLLPLAKTGWGALLLGLVGGGVLAAKPLVSKFSQISNNNKMKYSEGRIHDLLKQDQNNPQVQQELAKERQELANYFQKAQGYSAQSPQAIEYVKQLTGDVKPTIDQNGNNIGEGNGSTVQRLPIYNDQQLALQNQYLQELAKPQRGFEPIAQREIRRFHEQTAPQVAEQYFGKNPDSFGSAYPEALGRVGADLGERLAAMSANFEANREGRLQDIAFRPNFDSVYQPKQPTFWENVAINAAPNAVKALGQLTDTGVEYLNKRFGADEQKKQTNNQQQTNNVPEILSTVRKPSTQIIAQGDNALQRTLMEAVEQKNHTLGGGRR